MTTADCPQVREIPYIAPLNVFAIFAHEPWALFLDSAKEDPALGRYSFIAIDPFLTLTSKDNSIQLGTETLTGNPFTVLQQQLALYPLAQHPELPPFQGGIAGYFGYELNQHLENIPLAKIDDLQFADLKVGFYDLVMAFDHQQQRAFIFASGYPEKNSDARKQRAEQRIDDLITKINPAKQTVMQSSAHFCEPEQITPNFSAESYQTMVQKVITYIKIGDIFQANLSQRFLAPCPWIDSATPFSLYRRLRQLNPAPFAAYLNLEDTVIASASPERFLKLQYGKVETRPIKGTRPRGRNSTEDQTLATELLNSAKDRAENTMIVDLMRNDLSRVCRDHSVQVTKLCALESFATVHHLVSEITGQLKPEYTALDLLCATFPGGSITGAPKIRAMEIIAELEPHRRGPYCGSIGYIGFDNTMDLSITIRTLIIKNNKIVFNAGGGIVADSDPSAEHAETLTKAAGLNSAIIKITRSN